MLWVFSLHIGAHVQVNMPAPVQDVWLGLAAAQPACNGGGMVDTSGGWGELEAEHNEKTGCSEELQISRCHSARHLSRISATQAFFFGEYSKLNLFEGTCKFRVMELVATLISGMKHYRLLCNFSRSAVLLVRQHQSCESYSLKFWRILKVTKSHEGIWLKSFAYVCIKHELREISG